MIQKDTLGMANLIPQHWEKSFFLPSNRVFSVIDRWGKRYINLCIMQKAGTEYVETVSLPSTFFHKLDETFIIESLKDNQIFIHFKPKYNLFE